METEQDLEIQQRNLKKIIESNYKLKLGNQIRWAFGETVEKIAIFIIASLYIIFRPLNILVGGLLAIIILLIT